MNDRQIDGKLFTQMVLAGAQNLNRHVKDVDALNVFPVPDGDTGTNMNLSLTSGVNELKKINTDHIGKAAGALAKGLLMGARGNSGVILSQLFRGFSKYVSNFETIDSKQFADALKLGVDTAYKAVMKPVEGTILTVSREAAREAIKVARRETNIVKVMEETIAKGKVALLKTPDLLPVLKEVGVVDAGGQGLIFIYEGFLAALKGEETLQFEESVMENREQTSLAEMAHKHQPVQAKLSTEEIEFGYCTEFIVRLNEQIIKAKSFDEIEFRKNISKFGDSLLVVADDEIVKVHIHAEHPGDVLNFAMNFGSLHKIKIDNMREQHSHIVLGEGYYHDTAGNVESSNGKTEENMDDEATKVVQPYGIIAVALGEGISEIFKSLGVDFVISGGQTMNPSTEDIVNAMKEVHAEKYIILPNNSNIILAAEQAQKLVDQPVAVIPSKSIPQGMTALLSFNPNASLEENKELMVEALAHVKTGQVTYAVRDSKFEGMEIKAGDYLGIADGKIISTSNDMLETSFMLLKEMIDTNQEILTIIYGEDVNIEQLNELEKRISETYPDLEVEIHNGGQPLYYFIFSLEE
ncbi:DAK2 domain-containing protein [Tepidibacillus infernus]|uniref:DAK2 domain-containing protein n=1 Tax=Tepidibacillus TaxID=1494427 RepID=UPI000852BD79|nr:DAK2 domain-containing protein [Tepidibacillus sp. HK-1]GBF12201.1 DAK2 domain protein [Tepidibacillus sp. HK-1]